MKVYLITGDEDWGNQRKNSLSQSSIHLWPLLPEHFDLPILCRNNPPDVFLIDMDLGFHNTAQWCAQINAITPLTEIILLGSSNQPENGVKAMKTGVFNYLPKWLPPEALLYEIHKAYRQKKRNEKRVKFLRSSQDRLETDHRQTEKGV